MDLTRFRLPTTLTLTALGFGASQCASSTQNADAGPSDAAAPDAPSDGFTDGMFADLVTDAPADAATTCETACSAMFSAPATQCMPGTGQDGAAVCLDVADSGSSGICQFAPLVMTSAGPCCCQPVI